MGEKTRTALYLAAIAGLIVLAQTLDYQDQKIMEAQARPARGWAQERPAPTLEHQVREHEEALRRARVELHGGRP